MSADEPVGPAPEGLPDPSLARCRVRDDLEKLLNRHCAENETNTPDFILASYLMECLDVWDKHVNWRESWYGRRG